MTPPPTALTPEEQDAITRLLVCAVPPTLISPEDDIPWLVAIIRRLDARVLGEERAREEANSAEIAMAKRLDAAIPQMERMTGLQEDRNRWCEEAQRVKHQRDALARALIEVAEAAKDHRTNACAVPHEALDAALARLEEVESGERDDRAVNDAHP